MYYFVYMNIQWAMKYTITMSTNFISSIYTSYLNTSYKQKTVTTIYREFHIIANGGNEVVVFFLNRSSSCLPGACECTPRTFTISLLPNFFVNALTSHLNCGKLCGKLHRHVVINVFREHLTLVNSYWWCTNFSCPRRDSVNAASMLNPWKKKLTKILVKW